MVEGKSETLTLRLSDGGPIKEVSPLDAHTYIPRGTSALLDAIGQAIHTIGDRLGPEAIVSARVVLRVRLSWIEAPENSQAFGQLDCNAH